MTRTITWWRRDAYDVDIQRQSRHDQKATIVCAVRGVTHMWPTLPKTRFVLRTITQIIKYFIFKKENKKHISYSIVNYSLLLQAFINDRFFSFKCINKSLILNSLVFCSNWSEKGPLKLMNSKDFYLYQIFLLFSLHYVFWKYFKRRKKKM